VKIEYPKMLNPFLSPHPCHFIEKWGRWLPPSLLSLTRQAGLLPPEVTLLQNIPDGPSDRHTPLN